MMFFVHMLLMFVVHIVDVYCTYVVDGCCLVVIGCCLIIICCCLVVIGCCCLVVDVCCWSSSTLFRLDHRKQPTNLQSQCRSYTILPLQLQWQRGHTLSLYQYTEAVFGEDRSFW